MRNIKWEDGTHALRARRGMKRKLTTCRVEWYLGYLKSLNIWGSLRSDRSWSDIEDCSWKFYIYKWWLVCKSAGAEGAFGKWIRREFARMSCKLGELILSTREFEGTLDRTVVTLWEVLYPVYRLMSLRSWAVRVYYERRPSACVGESDTMKLRRRERSRCLLLKRLSMLSWKCV